MEIGKRLRHLREEKKFSQGDIEKRTGLLRCYISRVENGHTVPAVETLEKLARAMEIPVYKIFHDGSEPAQKPKLRIEEPETEWGDKGKDHDELRKFAKVLSRLDSRQRQILLKTALLMVRRKTD
jgi:transcriptional regulator with XRE-family HTH domain